MEDVISREFVQFLQTNDLVDLGFVEPRFTWCNNWFGGTRVWKCIDKVFATPEWSRLSWSLVMLPSDLRRFGWLILYHEILLERCGGCLFGGMRGIEFSTGFPLVPDIVREVRGVELPIRGNARYQISRRLSLIRR